jgi:hypothetical protein
MNYSKFGFAFVALTIALGAMAMPVIGATITVNPDGTEDYTTIQSAVDNAGEGDTVRVEPGVYHETVSVSQGNLTIESASDSGENVTILAVKANGTDAVKHTTSDTNGVLTLNNVSDVDESNATVGSSTEANYSTIQNATDNLGMGDKVFIEPGTYNESVNVTSDYMMFQSTNASQNVTVDASNTSDGQAFRTHDYTTYVDSDINTVNAVLGGGGSGSGTLDGTFAGVPNVVWMLVVALGGIVYYKRQEE